MSVQYFNHYLARVMAGRTIGLTDQYLLNYEPKFLEQKKPGAGSKSGRIYTDIKGNTANPVIQLEEQQLNKGRYLGHG